MHLTNKIHPLKDEETSFSKKKYGIKTKTINKKKSEEAFKQLHSIDQQNKIPHKIPHKIPNKIINQKHKKNKSKKNNKASKKK